MMEEVLTTILNPFKFPPISIPLPLAKLCQVILKRLERAETRIQAKTDSFAQLAAATQSIEESQRAMKLNKSIVRLTYLAVFFIPMAFLSSLFSMASDILALKNTLRIYFAIALPLTAFCFFAASLFGLILGLSRFMDR
jgi:Mg2+ and Co2+ transporter CorA